MSGALRARGAFLGALLAASVSCGAPAPALDPSVGETERPVVKVAEWPPLATPSDGGADPGVSTVHAALGCADGAQIRVRGYLVALSPACPRCNVVGQQGGATLEKDRIGKTARAGGSAALPGCAPCPPAAATFSDEAPTASPSPGSPPLRAVGTAEGLQPRHVGHVFLLTGTFHARTEQGPELEVTDVRALP